MIRAPANAALLRAHGATFVTQVARALLQHTREALCASQAPPPATDEAALSAALAARCQARLAPRLKAVLNLTGTVIHTNLGRAVLAPEAMAHVQA
ncbi:MAG: L-seryl-tRNA(Sec) selenium transferase, partial [Limnohabitans sp.]|nr:L-seryl-tRNA(Sec) selenium transferase [Limnohabitans sp.]